MVDTIHESDSPATTTPSWRARSYSMSSPSPSIVICNPLEQSSNPITNTLEETASTAFESPAGDRDQSQNESARRLMNQGESSQTPNSSGAPLQSLPTFDPRALLNPKAPTKRAAAEAESDRGRPEENGGGQVSLVERLHNVQQRTASPAKRIKTEEENKKKPPKPSFSGGGILDMKPKNEPPDHQSQSTAIDLTMSELNCLTASLPIR
jgi:hypothetical protein